MVLVNYATKEIVAKIVYYGPGLCGKTTNLQHIFTKLNPKKRGKMISLATEADRTLFFDFLPLELGVVQGFKVRFQLYTVPGQVFYGSTRKLVLKGADAVIFVADSQADVLGKNIESIDDMKENLLENSLDPYSMPIVFQYNKRDLANVLDVPTLDAKLNFRGAPFFEAVATQGPGVMETFKKITSLLIQDLKKKHSLMDKGTINELPPEVFESRPARQAASKAAVELEIEMGSRVSGADVDVVPGSLLEQVETISLADTIQAEAFFDNVRKGAPMEEAKQKAEMLGRIQPSGPPAERELTPDELESAEILPALEVYDLSSPEEAVEEIPPPPGLITEEYLGMDVNAPEVMGPVEQVEEEVYVTQGAGPVPETALAQEDAREETPAGPGPMPAPADLSPVLQAMERLEGEVVSLKIEIAKMGATGGGKDFEERLDSIQKGFKEAFEGQDRLLLSILEAVRDGRRANADAHEKQEDALKYIVEKFREEGKTAKKKKWF